MTSIAHPQDSNSIKKLLIVEDEDKTGNYLKKGLEEQGYRVELIRDGLTGLTAAMNSAFDLLILDVMLPGCDGWEILRTIRLKGINRPVLFLTAKDGVHDRVKGLESGADDYLVKPFDLAELIARVRMLLRRTSVQTPQVYTLADLNLEPVSRNVTRGGKRIHLTSKEFVLLELLLQRSGDVLPRSLISSLVWNINFDSGTNVIDVAIRRLRTKIDDGFEIKLIHTVRGAGYVMKVRDSCD